jgi:hypothetical protein
MESCQSRPWQYTIKRKPKVILITHIQIGVKEVVTHPKLCAAQFGDPQLIKKNVSMDLEIRPSNANELYLRSRLESVPQ